MAKKTKDADSDSASRFATYTREVDAVVSCSSDLFYRGCTLLREGRCPHVHRIGFETKRMEVTVEMLAGPATRHPWTIKDAIEKEVANMLENDPERHIGECTLFEPHTHELYWGNPRVV